MKKFELKQIIREEIKKLNEMTYKEAMPVIIKTFGDLGFKHEYVHTMGDLFAKNITSGVIEFWVTENVHDDNMVTLSGSFTPEKTTNWFFGLVKTKKIDYKKMQDLQDLENIDLGKDAFSLTSTSLTQLLRAKILKAISKIK